MEIRATPAKWIRSEYWIQFAHRFDNDSKRIFLPIDTIENRHNGAVLLFTPKNNVDFAPMRVSAHDHIAYQEVYPHHK